MPRLLSYILALGLLMLSSHAIQTPSQLIQSLRNSRSDRFTQQPVPNKVCLATMESPSDFKTRGFLTNAQMHQETPNWILFDHVRTQQRLAPNDGLIATFSTLEDCVSLFHKRAMSGWIYWIDPDPEFIGVYNTLQQYCPKFARNEWAHRGDIPWYYVHTYSEFRRAQPGRPLQRVQWTQRDDYSPPPDDEPKGGRPDYERAFPLGHAAWQLLPWKRVAPGTPHIPVVQVSSRPYRPPPAPPPAYTSYPSPPPPYTSYASASISTRPPSARSSRPSPPPTPREPHNHS